MFYLIYLCLGLLFQVVCFVFTFLPIFSIRVEGYYSFMGSRTYTYSLFDLFDSNPGLTIPFFILEIILIVIMCISLARQIKVFNKEKGISILNLVYPSIITGFSVISSILFVLFFIRRSPGTSFDMDEFEYIYYSRTALFYIFLAFVFLVVAFNLLQLIIVIGNMYIPVLKSKKFFSLISSYTPIKEEIKHNDSTNTQPISNTINDLSLDKITILEKLASLRDSGIISEEDFQRKKDELLK